MDIPNDSTTALRGFRSQAAREEPKACQVVTARRRATPSPHKNDPACRTHLLQSNYEKT